MSQVSGRDKLELYPEGSDLFFSRDVDMQIKFQRDDKGRVVGMVIRRLGLYRPAQLMSLAEAEKVATIIAEHARRMLPMPGGQEAVWRGADVFITGTPHFEDFTPEFAAEVRARMPSLQKAMPENTWGKALSIKFEKVGDDGSDVYVVEHEHAIVKWIIQLNSSGKIAEAFFVDLPK